MGKEINGVTVHHIDDLEECLKDRNVDIAALTLPKSQAEKTARKLVELGVKGIWNFALVDLDELDDVTVENVHLSDTLMQLSYNITKKK